MLHYIVVTFNTTTCHIQMWISICDKQQVGGGRGTDIRLYKCAQYHPENNVSCT